VEHDILELLAQAEVPGTESFQLDPRRAGQVLGRFQLSNPYFYVLKWIQWAVLACARQVWVEILPDRVSVWHDGELPEAPSAAELLSLEGAWGHFGSGFFAATQLEPTHIALATRRGSRTLYGHGESVERGVTVLAPRRKFHIQGYWWQELRLLLRPEAALVRFHCHYAPVPIFLNGKCVNRPLFGISCRVSGTHLVPLLYLARRAKGVLRERSAPRELLAAPDWDSAGDGEFAELQVWERPCLAARAMYFYLPPGPKASHHSEVTWVKDGVAICKETRLEDFPPGLHAVASCRGLELDASQFSPVRNAAYESRLGEILDLYARGAHRPVIG
jgi:hypothetical protein